MIRPKRAGCTSYKIFARHYGLFQKNLLETGRGKILTARESLVIRESIFSVIVRPYLFELRPELVIQPSLPGLEIGDLAPR
jgi:hypothetical protein